MQPTWKSYLHPVPVRFKIKTTPPKKKKLFQGKKMGTGAEHLLQGRAQKWKLFLYVSLSI
jgi:hypothetical protein